MPRVARAPGAWDVCLVVATIRGCVLVVVVATNVRVIILLDGPRLVVRGLSPRQTPYKPP